MLTIRNGRVAGVRFVAANSSGGPIKPELIVLHDTAGRLDKGSSVSWFQSKECKTSAHFVVERDGSITQMVATNRKGFHAGESRWMGRTYCNSFSVGIEIVNPGLCDAHGRAWFHKGETGYPISDLVHKATKEHGDGWWMPYTREQIAAVKDLCRAIVAEYPDCNEIVTHWMISPRRKIDTNPLFPLDEISDFALALSKPAEDEPEADVPDVPVKPDKKPVLPTIQGSKSLWTILTALGVKISETVSEWLGLLPDVQTEAAKSIDPLTSLGGWMGANMAWISSVVVMAAFAIVFVRHLNDKRSMP